MVMARRQEKSSHRMGGHHSGGLRSCVPCVVHSSRRPDALSGAGAGRVVPAAAKTGKKR